MEQKNVVLNLCDKPAARPALIAWLLGVSALWFVGIYLIRGHYVWTIGEVDMECVLLSFIHAVVMSRWQKHAGVVYKRDWLRIFVRLFAAVSMLFFPASLLSVSLDWSDYLEMPILSTCLCLLGLFLMILPLYVHSLICNYVDGSLPFWPSFRYIRSLKSGAPVYGYEGESAFWRFLMELGDSGYGAYMNAPSEMYDSEIVPERKDMTSDYYGRHGEFKTNEQVLAHLEDMQQMSSEPGFMPDEQGYDWDEISDAKNDGFI